MWIGPRRSWKSRCASLAALRFRRTAPATGSAGMQRRSRNITSNNCLRTHGRCPLPKMTGSRAFIDLLKQEGIEIMFGNPGTTELPLMDAFATENELRYLLRLQEAGVMAMADGYAQGSGRLTAVNLHVAPGLGNALGMLYDAQKAGSPILVTAGAHRASFTPHRA